jgi:hypothetical protein
MSSRKQLNDGEGDAYDNSDGLTFPNSEKVQDFIGPPWHPFPSS